MFKIYDGRADFYQWDLDRKLIVKDASITEVHFCNKLGDCALVCEVYTEGAFRVVNVPNILLQTEWRIKAYACAGSHTEFEACFDVKPRTKPADYIYTETEVKRYENFEERLAALEGKEVDLTGYATEEFVNSAIAENAPDWNADNGAKGNIANRTHYTRLVIPVYCDGELPEGTTRLLNLDEAQYKSMLSKFTLENIGNKYSTYQISIKHDFIYNGAYNNSFTMKPANGKVINDSINYYYTIVGGFTIYVILDRNTLTEELKALFPTKGIYTHTTNTREGAKQWTANLRYELRSVGQTLAFHFMPAQFLEAAEAETLYYKKSDVDSMLEALESRISALEG